MSSFPISLTPEAVDQAKLYLARKAPGSMLRIGVKGGGCTGLEYIMRPEIKKLPIDSEADYDGLIVLVDAKSAVYLLGTIVEWGGNLLGGAFKFNNPNADRSCGCGTSFSVKRPVSE